MGIIINLLALGATICGVLVKTFDTNKRRQKLLGWIIIGIALIICLINIGQSHKQKDALTYQANQRIMLRGIASIEIFQGLDKLCSLFYQMAPQEETDFFVSMLNYNSMLDRILTPEFINKLNATMLESPAPEEWGEYFSIFPVGLSLAINASAAINNLDQTIAKYSSCLDAQTILAVSAIQRHPFVRMMTSLRRSERTGPIIGSHWSDTNQNVYIDMISQIRTLHKDLCQHVSPDLLKTIEAEASEIMESNQNQKVK